MKNKKMVATLASLCLIVVAVVAAVVGVLAAVTQSVASTMKVSYTAKNVDATVSLQSMGPTASGDPITRALETAYTQATGEGTKSHRFNPADAYSQVTLVGKDYNFGWASESGTSGNFLGIAIYQFKFENHSSHILEVTPTIDGTAVSSKTNLQFKFVRSETDAALGLNTAAAYDYTDFKPAAGAIWGSNGTIDNTFAISDATDTAGGYEDVTTGTAFDVAPHGVSDGVMYVYMIVALASSQTDVQGGSTQMGDLSGIISFTLADPGISERPAQEP